MIAHWPTRTPPKCLATGCGKVLARSLAFLPLPWGLPLSTVRFSLLRHRQRLSNWIVDAPGLVFDNPWKRFCRAARLKQMSNTETYRIDKHPMFPSTGNSRPAGMGYCIEGPKERRRSSIRALRPSWLNPSEMRGMVFCHGGYVISLRSLLSTSRMQTTKWNRAVH